MNGPCQMPATHKIDIARVKLAMTSSFDRDMVDALVRAKLDRRSMLENACPAALTRYPPLRALSTSTARPTRREPRLGQAQHARCCPGQARA